MAIEQTGPRIPPLPPQEHTGGALEALAGDGALYGAHRRRPVPHVFATMAHHPELCGPTIAVGQAMARRGRLPERERELLVLRTAVRCRSEYEWAHHCHVARAAGLTDAEIARVGAGPGAPGWSDAEADLLRAADELHDHGAIGETTWARLAARLDRAQLIEVILVVGEYHKVAMLLNTLGTPVDAWLDPVPPLPADHDPAG